MTYENLQSYQQAKQIYDLTVEFCNLYIEKTDKSYRSDRMAGQMIQAARSGKQNIAEGSAQSKQKPKSELYLLSIASASLKELLEDYQDFLRQRDLEQWSKNDERALAVRRLTYTTYKTYKSYTPYKSYTTYKTYKTCKTYKSYLNNPESAANMMICLINQTTYLLDQQIRATERQMKAKGIALESQSQKFGRLAQENKRNNEEFDKKLKEIMQGKRNSLED